MQSYAVITTVNFKPFISSPKETAPFATCQLSFLAQIFSAFVGSDFFYSLSLEFISSQVGLKLFELRILYRLINYWKP